MKHSWSVRCATRCTDRAGRPRPGSEWVHIHGLTWWVCTPCAERLGSDAGIPTATERRRRVTLHERRLQLPLPGVP
jgi:hypothetical protein